MNSENKVIGTLFRKTMTSMSLSLFTTFLAGIIDSIIISRFLGMESMSAFQLANPIMLIFGTWALFMNFGFSGLYCGYLGKGEVEASNRAFTLALSILAGVTLMLVLFFEVFADPVVTFLGAQAGTTLHKEAVAYIRGYIAGYLLMAIMPIFHCILNVEGRRSLVLGSMVVQTIINVIGDLLCGFVFKNGLFGMGVASSLAFIGCMLFIVIRLLINKPSFRLDFSKPNFADIKVIAKFGLPAGVERLCNTLQIYFFNIFLLTAGSIDYVAAFALISTIFRILSSVGEGASSSIFSFVSVFKSERDRKSSNILFRVALKYTAIVELVILVLTIAFAPLIIDMFVSGGDTAVREIAIWGLRLYSGYIMLNALILTYGRYVQAMENMFLSYFIPVMNNLVLFVPAYILLTNVFGVEYVWLGFVVAQLFTILAIIIYVIIRDKKLILKLEDYMMIPANLDEGITDTVSLSAGNIDEIMNISDKAVDFCKNNNLNERTAMIVGLAIEEMGKNVFEWNKSGVSVDVRLMYGDETLLRIRDNGIPFNAQKWLQIHNQEDPTKNIGLRVISGMAKDFQYMNTLGSNTVIIRLGA